MEKSFFDIDNGSLSKLGPEDGVRLMRDLLWCEASRLGISRQNVVISANVTVADGGVDARVDFNADHQSILANGQTHYQIKTGSSFKPWEPSALKKELFGIKPASRESLGEAVVKCLEAGGTYSIIALGQDPTPLQQSNSASSLIGLLKQCGFDDPKVSVLGQTQIIGELMRYPSLCLDINGRGDFPFQSVESWSRMNDMTPPLALGELQNNFITELQACLESSDIGHIRIVGEPGVGKSRLALEAIKGRSNLSSSTIYIRAAADFQKSRLFIELLKPGRDFGAVLVIDECEDSDRTDIWRALRGKAGIKLVSIDHGPADSGDSDMRTLQVPPLADDEITEILHAYLDNVDIYRISNWVRWCDGSARVAHAVGENLKSNPDDILRPPSTVPIWDRFVSGYNRADSAEAERSLVVLRHVALFQKFGFKPPVSSEADYVAALVAETDPSITRAKFNSIVKYYCDRRILQGDRTLRIVPKALHVYLWCDWWKQYGDCANFNDIMDKMPRGLHRWFTRLFIYAHQVESAQRVVKQLLSPRDGKFCDREFLTSTAGSSLLAVLAEADPLSTLVLLEATLGKWSDEDLKQFTGKRDDFAWTLEKIAVWRECCRRAAKILARLTIGDLSKNTNNARGIFLAVFSPSWAATEAPLDERASLARDMLRSTDPYEKELGLAACKAILETRGGSRMVGSEYQGMRPEVQFWRPTEYEQIAVPMRDTLASMMKAREGNDLKWTGAIDAALMEVARPLFWSNCLRAEVTQVLEELAKAGANFSEMIKVVIFILFQPGQEVDEGILERIRCIEARLVGTTFNDHMRRYVLNHIVDEYYDVNEGGESRTEVAKERRSSLARKAAMVGGLLEKNFGSMYLTNATYGLYFSYQLRNSHHVTRHTYRTTL